MLLAVPLTVLNRELLWSMSTAPYDAELFRNVEEESDAEEYEVK